MMMVSVNNDEKKKKKNPRGEAQEAGDKLVRQRHESSSPEHRKIGNIKQCERNLTVATYQTKQSSDPSDLIVTITTHQPEQFD